MSARFTHEELQNLGINIPGVPHGTAELHGDWVSGFLIALETPVVSKSNYRRHQRDGQRWGQVQKFEDTLRRALKESVPDNWPFDPGTIPLKERHGIIGVTYAKALLDTSNLSKSIYDAAEGVLYFNDAQIRAEASFLDRGRNNSILICGFAALAPGTTASGTQSNVAALSGHVLGLADVLKPGIH